MSGGAVKLINAYNKMKKVLKVIGIGSLVTSGLTMGFNLGMLIGYIKDADLVESKIHDTPSFPV
jgi:cell shape-determining protein MreC